MDARLWILYLKNDPDQVVDRPSFKTHTRVASLQGTLTEVLEVLRSEAMWWTTGIVKNYQISLLRRFRQGDVLVAGDEEDPLVMTLGPWGELAHLGLESELWPPLAISHERVDDWYIKEGRCPVCGADEVLAQPEQESDDHNTIQQRAGCGACGAMWWEHYNLVAISNITTKDGEYWLASD